MKQNNVFWSRPRMLPVRGHRGEADEQESCDTDTLVSVESRSQSVINQLR